MFVRKRRDVADRPGALGESKGANGLVMAWGSPLQVGRAAYFYPRRHEKCPLLATTGLQAL